MSENGHVAALGTQRLLVSGGEPTLHPVLEKVVQRATRQHRMHVCLETNALRLGQSAYLQRLMDAGLGEVFVSLHSHEAARSDELTRAPGTHAKTLAGVRACLKAELGVTLNCVVLRENVEHLAAFAEFVCSELPGVQRVVFSQPSGAFDPEFFDAHSTALDRVKNALPPALDRLLAHGVTVECVGTCGFPPCVVPDHPQLWRALGPDQVPAFASLRRDFVPACSACAARPHCLGLRGEYLQRHGEGGIAPLTQFA